MDSVPRGVLAPTAGVPMGGTGPADLCGVAGPGPLDPPALLHHAPSARLPRFLGSAGSGDFFPPHGGPEPKLMVSGVCVCV